MGLWDCGTGALSGCGAVCHLQVIDGYKDSNETMLKKMGTLQEGREQLMEQHHLQGAELRDLRTQLAERGEHAASLEALNATLQQKLIGWDQERSALLRLLQEKVAQIEGRYQRLEQSQSLGKSLTKENLYRQKFRELTADTNGGPNLRNLLRALLDYYAHCQPHHGPKPGASDTSSVAQSHYRTPSVAGGGSFWSGLIWGQSDRDTTARMSNASRASTPGTPVTPIKKLEDALEGSVKDVENRFSVDSVSIADALVDDPGVPTASGPAPSAGS